MKGDLIMNTSNPLSERDTAGKNAGWTGLFGNLILTLVKFAIGYFSNSIAVIADAFNNLTDCISSVITIFGFSIAGRKEDRVHPYGHGRIEYICGFTISIFILITAVSVGKDSIKRLIHPETIHFSTAIILILLMSALIKLIMAWLVNRTNKTISSPALKAVRNDNLSDALVTAVTLSGILIAPFTSFPVDALLGLLVSLSVLWSGLTSFAENFALLLGKGADSETEQKVRQMLLDYPLIRSVETIALHDYGPEEKFAFIKVTFQSSPHTPEASGTLDQIKLRLRSELHIEATLYWDLADKKALKKEPAI